MFKNAFKKPTAREPVQELEAYNLEAGEAAVTMPRLTVLSVRKPFGRRETDTGVVPSIYDNNCIFGTTEIGKKDIINYIKGMAEPLLGSDYYYGYVYREGQLAFVATKSAKHAAGKLSVFSFAFLNEGVFYYRRGGSFHVFSTEAPGKTAEVIVYDKPESAICLNLPQPIDKKTIPATLYLRWSLKKTGVSVGILAALAFIVSLSFLMGANNKYETVSRNAKFDPLPPPQIKTLHLNPDMGSLVAKVGKDIAGRGIIASIRAQGEALLFTIAFKDETEARAFIAKAGSSAVFENGKVRVPLDPIKNEYIQIGPPSAPPGPPAIAPAAPQPNGGMPKV
jgi:hypothetical protein